MAKRNTYDEDEELEEKFNLHDYVRVAHYLTPYRRRLGIALASILLGNVAVIMGPFLP